MLEQLFELSRKAAESSVQMQQVMFKQLTQSVLSASPASGISADWGGTMRKQWVEFTLETLNKQREAIDSTYKNGIQTIEQLSRVSEAKSPEEGIKALENVWSKVFESFKSQTESQFRDFQAWAAKSLDMAKNKTAT